MTEHDEGTDVDGIIEDMADQLRSEFKVLSLEETTVPRRTWLHGDVNCRCVIEWPAMKHAEKDVTVTVHVAPECRLHGVGTETLQYLREIEAGRQHEAGLSSRYDAMTNWQDVHIEPQQWKSLGNFRPLGSRELPSGDNELHG